MNNTSLQTILKVHHWTNKLFTFYCTRNRSFKFNNGQFTMLGIHVKNKLIMRAYSIVSANYEENLEFLSIKVKNGPLTSNLIKIKCGDQITISKKATGTLTINNLLPGNVLWLISTGTGIAPFLSIIKDPETYKKYNKIILTHTCRFIKDLVYKNYITKEIKHDKYIGNIVNNKLIYYPCVTREKFINNGRITDLIKTKKIFNDLNQNNFSSKNDRIMICGNSNMLEEIKYILKKQKLSEGNTNKPGHYILEKAFVS